MKQKQTNNATRESLYILVGQRLSSQTLLRRTHLNGQGYFLASADVFEIGNLDWPVFVDHV